VGESLGCILPGGEAELLGGSMCVCDRCEVGCIGLATGARGLGKYAMGGAQRGGSVMGSLEV
jgi:hypothetical protein